MKSNVIEFVLILFSHQYFIYVHITIFVSYVTCDADYLVIVYDEVFA